MFRCPVFGEITELNKTGSRITGLVQAPEDSPGMGFGLSVLINDVNAHTFCFSGSMAFLGEHLEKVATDLLAGEESVFSVELPPDLGPRCAKVAMYIE